MLMLRKTLLPSLDTGLWLSCRDWILSGRGNTGREVREELCNVENTVRTSVVNDPSMKFYNHGEGPY